MDLNDLNNKQMILLTMFTSFVTAIATGIITAAILQEAPRTVTQTVNRVVERTIERVVTGTSTKEVATPAPIQTVTKEVTVYAKEDDLVVAAVEKNQPRIARVFAVGAATATEPLGLGFLISRDGLLIADRRALAESGELKADYAVSFGEKQYSAKLMKPEGFEKQSVAFLKVAVSGETFDAVAFAQGVDLKVAQTAVVLGGIDGVSVFKTTVARIVSSKGEGTTTPKILVGVETTPRIPEGNAGALVVNLDGQAIGISVWSETNAKYIIYPAERILELVSSLAENAAKSAEADVQGKPPAAQNTAATGAVAPPANN